MSVLLGPPRPLWTLAALLVGLACGAPVWALQRDLKSKVLSYPKAPVEVRRSDATLVETYTSPTQMMAPDAKTRTTRVRYANRAGLAPSVFVLRGEIMCANASPQAVEAVSLTIVVLDAFHQPVQLAGRAEPSFVHQVTEPLPRGASKRIAWEQQVNTSDVFEVAVVVTKVRFADGSVWMAPSEELLDIF